jgi:hypothetical protein
MLHDPDIEGLKRYKIITLPIPGTVISLFHGTQWNKYFHLNKFAEPAPEIYWSYSGMSNDGSSPEKQQC